MGGWKDGWAGYPRRLPSQIRVFWPRASVDTWHFAKGKV